MSETEVFMQQVIYGLSNGMIIALVALGYTMVYGIVELINFAHGDVFTLGGFLALTIVGALGAAAVIDPNALGESSNWLLLFGLVIGAGLFCGMLNVGIDRVVYKPLRRAPKLTQLVAAIGVSFILAVYRQFKTIDPIQLNEIQEAIPGLNSESDDEAVLPRGKEPGDET